MASSPRYYVLLCSESGRGLAKFPLLSNTGFLEQLYEAAAIRYHRFEAFAEQA